MSGVHSATARAVADQAFSAATTGGPQGTTGEVSLVIRSAQARRTSARFVDDVMRFKDNGYTSTITLKPPYSIRFISNGMVFGFIAAKRGSFMTLALTRSRWLRDLYTIHENTTVSPGFSFNRRGKGTMPLTARSSPTHSRTSRAPCSRQILPAFSAMRRYACTFFLGTGITKPST